MSDDSPKRASGLPGKILFFLAVGLFGWLAAGTEWALVFDKRAFLTGIAFEDVGSEGDTCTATIDTAGLPRPPSAVAVQRISGREPIELEEGRGTLTYPRGSGSLEIRLTYVGVLRKPSHADLGFTQRGCQLQPTSFNSWPVVPW